MSGAPRRPAGKVAPTVWIGHPAEACDLCSEAITDTFIDGRTRFGPWANMCPACHRDSGTGLGTGSGQKFQRQLDGRWLKTAAKD